MMKENYINKIRKKLRLFAFCFILTASISHIPPAASSGQVCQLEELGSWTRKATLSLKTTIRIRLGASNWQPFVLDFQANDSDKFKLIFERETDGIKLKGLGFTPSPDKIPLSFIQYGQESVLSFAKSQNDVQMTIRNGLKDHSISLTGLNFDYVDSVRINSQIGSPDRTKSIINFCNLDPSGSKPTGLYTTSPISCPEPPSCPALAPSPVPEPCPKPTPCPLLPFITTSRPCPIPTPCPTTTTTAVFERTPCPPPAPCPIKACPTVPTCPPVTCPTSPPCPSFEHTIPVNPCPTVVCSSNPPQIVEDPMTSDSQDLVYESLKNTLGHDNAYINLLDDDPKNMIIFGLAAGSALLLIISVALGIALCKTKFSKRHIDSNASTQKEYFTQNSPSTHWISEVPYGPQSSNADFDIGPSYQSGLYRDPNDCMIKCSDANCEGDSDSDWSNQEPIYENVSQFGTVPVDEFKSLSS